jgi:hypothetical protein
MRFIIRPLIGVNDIEFDMSPEQVRCAMNRSFRSFDVRGPFGLNRSDQFHEAGKIAHYDADWLLEAVDFYSPARVLVCDANLMKLSIRRAGAVLSRLDPGVIVDRDGARARSLSLAAWSPEAYQSIDVRVDSFLAGRLGYYDLVGEHG